MRTLDNLTLTLKSDLENTIHSGSKVSIAAAYFSIYAYQQLKTQLESVDEFRFLFTSPTFVKEKGSKVSREFYIPRLDRERSIYGTAFEVKLRNELTQKAIAKECADWIRRKACFKSNVTNQSMQGYMNVDDTSYIPIDAFDVVNLGCDRGNRAYAMIIASQACENGRQFLKQFDHIWNDAEKLEDVTEVVIDSIAEAYKENAPEFIYFCMLYNIFNEFLDDISSDELPNEANGFKESQIWNRLYDFQKDAALAIINKLEKYNGCILADSVGLGKTFTALSVIKYYENRNMRVLVLCPKKLAENWNMYKNNYRNNPIASDRLRYDVLFHSDLTRDYGLSNGNDLSLLNWGNYDLIVIDESHNFRNGEGSHVNTHENRYKRLMDKAIKAGVKTKVLMLSATPVNNKFFDLKNQLALAYEGNSSLLDDKLDTEKSLDEVFKNAQTAYTHWSKLPSSERTTERLLKMLDFDFFEMLDSVTIARSRKHIEKYYSMNEIGSFPERLNPISVRPHLTDLEDGITYGEIYDTLDLLNLEVYSPTKYIHPSKLYKYVDESQGNLTQLGRETGLIRLMRMNLLKRLECSVEAFRLTLERVASYIEDTIGVIKTYQSGSRKVDLREFVDEDDDSFTIGRKIQIDLADMDHVRWLAELEADEKILQGQIEKIGRITPDHDCKLQQLFLTIKQKLENPINEGNRKILIFTASTDTADYLYRYVSWYVKNKFGLDTAEVTGSTEGKSTIKGMRGDLNTVLTMFSPVSKDKKILYPNNKDEIDVLIATDCISEGQNLQDCDYLINYDIHWNPVRIIQRFGRIDRIGSRNKYIQLVNFWPDVDLDEYIGLKNRVETRMKITIMTSTGDDDLINAEEKGDLEYRRTQLKRLQTEVVDLEDMSEGISIMDLGLNEFRLDLLEYMKTNDSIERAPHGLHAVVGSDAEHPSGIIFVLKNINETVNIEHRNRIHPFYMTYIASDGSVVCDYLNPKKLLDSFRYLCKGKHSPDKRLCKIFNKETKDGHQMDKVSKLLSDAIKSIIQTKEENDVDSLFKPGGTTALLSKIKGLEDFELICFLAVR